MSLRARLLGLVLLATLLPALLLGWRFVRDNDAAISLAVATLSSRADAIASDLQHRVQGTAQLHHGLAYSRVFDSADRAACSEYLSAVREAYPQYTGILTVLPDGRLHCDSLRTGRDLLLTDRGYFQRAQAGATGLILEPVFGRLTGNSVLQVVYPARTETGALRFLLVASLNLQKFAQEAQRQSLLDGAELLLVDDKGLVMALAGTASGLPAPGQSIADSAVFALARAHAPDAGGTGELTGPDGRAQVWAVAASPAMQAAGLRVMLGQPRELLTARSRQRLRQGLVLLAGASLLLFGGVWALAEWGIRRQVGRIATMVQRLGAGDLAARIEQPFPRGELGGLMAEVNRTADSLQQQRRAIDALDLQLRQAHQREIHEREHNESRLSRLANYDSLTGLPNRSLFRDRLQGAMARSHRSGRPFALMFLDIDRFKNINDSLGHDVGDQLLVGVARLLLGCVRGTDSVGHDGETGSAEGVFRLGGDEFTVLAEDLAEREAVAGVARRILAALSQPFQVGEHELYITGSIGITVFADDGTDLDGLVKQADIAMYRAKALGRDTYCFFDPQLNAAVHSRQQMEASLRHALQRDEFVLHYQPKIHLASGQVTGVEALLRWQQPGQPVVGPDQFIPILEETGLIVAVGAWVLRQACAQMVAWQASGLPALQLAVNLSARQCRHPGLVGQVAEVLAATGFTAAALEVELTEGLLIDDSDTVRANMAGLGALGVGIAIDDFGTGHASMRYLKRFAVNTLKIDRAFVAGLPHSRDDLAITQAVIALGHGLGLKVVAEGVETQPQADFLRNQGCDELQGYLLCRPLEATALAAWLAQRAGALLDAQLAG